ncbi:MAG: preprotein translocase subunit SecA [Eubacteriaceae bacterium]|nr:preprotein translocase subunit SecA [Eubacteriaceae bacterium]
MGLLSKISNRIDARELKQYTKLSERVIELDSSYQQLSERQLQGKTAEFRNRIDNGESLDSLLPEAFAAVREASQRVLGMKHFPVQIIGGAILHSGNIAEMKTGEGKTLVATLPSYLNALSGQGVHIVTVNDYLATRDADWMGKIHKFLGLSVGLIVHGEDSQNKRKAYNSDITYGTNNEYGFDYLRDNMVVSLENMVQRKLNYAIVDEVDSILVDEARTPLIISGSGQESTQMYKRANSFALSLREGEFTVDEKQNAATLTDEGVSKAERYFGIANLAEFDNIEMQHYINQALKAQFLMKLDVDYVSIDGEIIIVDEFTGRLMPGRRYNEGLHQAIEAKEGLKVARESVTLATITFQNYFRLYNKLAGMTGTAKTEEEEFKSIYGMQVVSVPTNMPMIRSDLNDLIYKSEEGKFKAVLSEIEERHKTGQPILVGTISIEKSEKLSKMLTQKRIPHEVLNAKHHEKEAEIIAKAGQAGNVTISTNMAGRGTDIILGEGVTGIGGLHVIGTERHEARRIDNQLRGRSGRQGDPGSSQFFLSLEDDLFRLFGQDRMFAVMDKIGMDEDEAIEAKILTRTIESAQKSVEGRNFGIRKNVLKYDDVMNKQREVIYSQRREVIEGIDVYEKVMAYIEEIVSESVGEYFASRQESDSGSLASLENELNDIFGTSISFEGVSGAEGFKAAALGKALEKYKQREEHFGPENMRHFEKLILLRIVDNQWMDHIDNMDQLRQGISLHAYAQNDPVQVYTKESLDMFDAMGESIKSDTVRTLYHFEVREQESMPEERMKPPAMSTNSPQPQQKVQREGHVAKNAPCPCGSGKKYKRCCGKDAA